MFQKLVTAGARLAGRAELQITIADVDAAAGEVAQIEPGKLADTLGRCPVVECLRKVVGLHAVAGIGRQKIGDHRLGIAHRMGGAERDRLATGMELITAKIYTATTGQSQIKAAEEFIIACDIRSAVGEDYADVAVRVGSGAHFDPLCLDCSRGSIVSIFRL